MPGWRSRLRICTSQNLPLLRLVSLIGSRSRIKKKEKTSRHRYKSFLRGCFQLSLQCKSRIRARHHKLTFIRLVMFDLELGWTVGGRERGETSFLFIYPLPSPSFWLPHTPLLVQKSFYPQPSTVVKIKDSRYTFNQEKTEHSLAKITPVS